MRGFTIDITFIDRISEIFCEFHFCIYAYLVSINDPCGKILSSSTSTCPM